MHRNADVFLALRYLRPKRTFVSVISLLSVLGPVLGVALLIIVTSVMSGFDRNIRERILSMQAHLYVYPTPSLTDQRPVISDVEPVLEELRRAGAAGSPIIEGPVLIQHQESVEAKYVKGIVPATERAVTDIHKYILQGRYEIEEGEALIGSELAFQLGLGVGDQILVHSPRKLTRNVEWREDGGIEIRKTDEVYLPEEITIVGLFSLGLYEYDSSIILIHLDQAAELFGYDWDSATSVHARVPDPFRMTDLAHTIQAHLPTLRVVTWQQANQQLFGALRVEKNLMFFLLVFIVIVAAFGIAGTLITVAVQKTKEIGILKAVGMTSGVVARIFLLQGAIIGVIGTALGTGAGLLIIHYRNQVAALLGTIMGVEVFPQELYHLSEIPARVTAGDVILIDAVAIFICACGALIPALYASLLSPAAALQEENG